MDEPRKNSRWRETIPTGFSADPRLEVIRVMGVVENYVVARRTGCMPFVAPIRDWSQRFEPISKKDEA